MVLNMLFSAPRILRGIRKEHRVLQQLILDKRINLVISDNRYGLWSNLAPCIFITHQLNIQSPAGAGLLRKLSEKYIKRYTECWIPDLKGEGNLSGDLAHKGVLPESCYFIGPLSRFNSIELQQKTEFDIVISLSGPEPQRTAFEKLIKAQATHLPGRILLLQGMPDKSAMRVEGKLTIASHLSSSALMQAIAGADILIGRSGYSSIMDAAVLGKKCIFIPTPGQTEQEYLADYHAALGHCIAINQNSFSLSEAIAQVKSIKGFKKGFYSDEGLNERLKIVLKG